MRDSWAVTVVTNSTESMGGRGSINSRSCKEDEPPRMTCSHCQGLSGSGNIEFKDVISVSL